MAVTEKVISFRGDAGNLISTVQQIRQTTGELKDRILEDVLEMTRGTGDFTQVLEEQIKAFERRAKVTQVQERVGITRKFAGRIRAEEAGVAQFEERYGGKLSVETIKFRREQGEQRIQGLRREERQEIRETGLEEDLQVKMLREMIETLKSTSKEEIRADKTGVEQTISDFRKGRMDDASAEVKAKTKIQSGVLEQEAEGRRRGRGVFRGAFGGAALGTFAGQILGRAGQFGQQLAGAPTEEFFMAQALGAVPFLGPMASVLQQRHLQAREAKEQGISLMRGVTGLTAEEAYLGAVPGITRAEVTRTGAVLARARGGRGNIAADTREMLNVSKAFGLDQGMLMNMTTLMGLGGGGGGGNMLDVLNIALRGAGAKGVVGGRIVGPAGEAIDVSGMSNQLKAIAGLMQEQAGTLESIDSTSAAQAVNMFQGFTGGWDPNDPRFAQRVVGLNRALARPTTEFAQAMSFATLSKIKPGASYLELLKMQEAGFETPGYLAGQLGFYEKYLGGDLSVMQIKRDLGIESFTIAETLMEEFRRDPRAFEGQKGKERLAEIVKKKDLEGLGVLYTSQTKYKAADLTDSFAISAAEGLKKAGTEVGKEIAEMIKGSGIPFAEAVGNKLIEMIEGRVETKPKMTTEEVTNLIQSRYPGYDPDEFKDFFNKPE